MNHALPARSRQSALTPALALVGAFTLMSALPSRLAAEAAGAKSPHHGISADQKGQAGELVRERLGDAGLLAGDLPDALPIVRKRLAMIAERQRSGRRLGFGVRHGNGDSDGTAEPGEHH